MWWRTAPQTRLRPGSRHSRLRGGRVWRSPRSTPTRATRSPYDAHCRTRRSSWTTGTSCASPTRPSTRPDGAPSRRPWGTGAARATRSLYDVRKLLLVARQRLTSRAIERITDALRLGDPYFEVEAVWVGKELLRHIYAADGIEQATERLDAFLDWAHEVDIPELTRLAGTVRHWRTRVLAYHHNQITNARTEAMNLLAKKVKRVGFGFRNFRNYRMRLLLHCGVTWNVPATTKIRGRSPSVAA